MAPSSANILTVLKNAREENVKELNAIISVTEELLQAVEDVDKNLEEGLNKEVGKPIITKLYHSHIQKTLAQGAPASFHPSPAKPSGIPQNPIEINQTSSLMTETPDQTSLTNQRATRSYAQAVAAGGATTQTIGPSQSAVLPSAVPPPPRRREPAAVSS
jgi:hypothetical protein